MTEPEVLSSRHGAVELVELNRPHRLNAMTKALVRQLLAALDRAAVDPDVRAVVLTGVGRGFCAGGDLHDHASASHDIDVQAEAAEIRVLHRTSLLLHEMAKPTVAAVNGPCAGAGFALACAADLRVASETAVFRTSFASTGLTGAFGSAWTLPRIVGTARAREFCLLNPVIDAAEALRVGLVSEVVAFERIRERALELATQLARQAPLAMAGIKANLNDAVTSTFAELLDLEADRQAVAMTSEDSSEAAQAFLAKREPVFVGR